ncbi:MAG: ArsC/Spx/MgsR family protein, partial [Salegentibacter sp.]
MSLSPIQLVRKNEKIWKEEYRDKDLSDKELIHVMVKHPKLIERPIVENEREAVIGRPASDIEKVL